MNIESEPKDYSASPVLLAGQALYRCNECCALALTAEDARAHLWWHDKLVTVKP